MKKIAIILIIVLAFCVPARAADIILKDTLVQSELEEITKELGFAISYTPLAPAAPLGLLGFNIGIEATMLDIEEKSPYWLNAVTGELPDFLSIPKLHVQKGLPLKIDVGVIYSQIPGTNVSLMGGELKWAVIKGSAITPAFALRGSYTKLDGVDTLDLETMGIDASISKGFVFLTPYVGIGEIWISAKEKLPALDIPEVKKELTKVYAGIKFDPFPLVSLTAEVDYAEIMAYSLRLSVNF